MSETPIDINGADLSLFFVPRERHVLSFAFHLCEPRTIHITTYFLTLPYPPTNIHFLSSSSKTQDEAAAAGAAGVVGAVNFRQSW
jgi:hypothetical protein